MASVRNPLAGFGITICVSLGLSFLAGLPVLILPQREIVYFYLPFALFGVGLFAGRGGFLGLVGFVGATLGAFIGTYAVQLLFVPQGWPMWPADWTVLMTLAFGAACGLGGLVMGKIGLRRIDRLSEHGPKMRRCLRCGAKVGIAARKCWSCHGYLPPT